MNRPIWLLSGKRTPFTRVDGGLAKYDALGTSRYWNPKKGLP